MSRKTQAQLEQELADASARITALEQELANRVSGKEDDIIPDSYWAEFRRSLKGDVAEDDDHAGVLCEAIDQLRKFAAQPDGIEEIVEAVRTYTEDLSGEDEIDRIHETFQLREDWVSHGLEDLESSLWRAGVLRHGISMFEALESLTNG